MTRKILSLKLNKKKDIEQADAVVEDVLHSDPLKRFLNGVAVNPSQCIRLEVGSQEPTMRAMDLISPIGRGQRGLIVAPPGCGKTTLLKHLCQAVGTAYPEIK